MKKTNSIMSAETSANSRQSFQNLRDAIYTIRGVQVMLDADLAAIYGYETKTFNQQVKNNIEKFDDDFRFQLTKEEYKVILRSKVLTSKNERRGGRQYLPYVFTEQGIYMLMTVLNGDLATQSCIFDHLPLGKAQHFCHRQLYRIENACVAQIRTTECFDNHIQR